MANVIQEQIEVDISLYERCQDCHKRVRKWEYRLIGLCRRCYSQHFPTSYITEPPLRMRTKKGWQSLLSARELAESRKWIDEIIERVDRELKNTKDSKQRR